VAFFAVKKRREKNIMLASDRKFLHFRDLIKQQGGQHETCTQVITDRIFCQGL